MLKTAIATMFTTTAMVATAATPAPIVLTPNTIVLRGEVSGTSVAKVMQSLFASDGDVTLFISSPGGSVIDGYHLMSAIQSYPGKVTCIDSFAASMAYAITQVCEDRVVMPSTIMMQHVASFGTQGQMPNVLSFVGLITRLTKEVDVLQADRMKMDYNKFKTITRDDLWLTGGEAVSVGAADRVSEVVCSKEAMKGKTEEKVMFFGIPLTVTWSTCPLVSVPLEIGIGGAKGELTPDQWKHVQNALGYNSNLTRDEIVEMNSRVANGK